MGFARMANSACYEFQALGKPGFSFIDATDQLSPALTDTVL